jgi:3',5'-cyclic AMP phosphodiesterase CpdA
VSGGHRVIVLTDTHLSVRNAPAHAQLDVVIDHVASERYDAVVHLGDVCVDAPGHPDELMDARGALGRLPMPLHVIPGNHDVGDGRYPTVDPDDVVDEARLARYGAVFGADRWRVDFGSWTVLGVDAQLFGSGLAADDEQWAWLDEELALASGERRRVVLCSHKPVRALEDHARAGRDGRDAMWYVPLAAELRLAAACAPHGPVEVVLSGHVHQSRRTVVDGCVHVWVPSAWGYLPDDVQPTFGAKEVAVAIVSLPESGSAAIDLVRVPGLRQLEVGVTTLNPYGD